MQPLAFFLLALPSLTLATAIPSNPLQPRACGTPSSCAKCAEGLSGYYKCSDCPEETYYCGSSGDQKPDSDCPCNYSDPESGLPISSKSSCNKCAHGKSYSEGKVKFCGDKKKKLPGDQVCQKDNKKECGSCKKGKNYRVVEQMVEPGSQWADFWILGQEFCGDPNPKKASPLDERCAGYPL